MVNKKKIIRRVRGGKVRWKKRMTRDTLFVERNIAVIASDVRNGTVDHKCECRVSRTKWYQYDSLSSYSCGLTETVVNRNEITAELAPLKWHKMCDDARLVRRLSEECFRLVFSRHVNSCLQKVCGLLARAYPAQASLSASWAIPLGSTIPGPPALDPEGPSSWGPSPERCDPVMTQVSRISCSSLDTPWAHTHTHTALSPTGGHTHWPEEGTSIVHSLCILTEPLYALKTCPLLAFVKLYHRY